MPSSSVGKARTKKAALGTHARYALHPPAACKSLREHLHWRSGFQNDGVRAAAGVNSGTLAWGVALGALSAFARHLGWALRLSFRCAAAPETLDVLCRPDLADRWLHAERSAGGGGHAAAPGVCDCADGAAVRWAANCKANQCGVTISTDRRLLGLACVALTWRDVP